MDVSNLTVADLDAMQAVDVKTVDRATLRDIREVGVDTELPKRERILDFIGQIGNPYCFRCGDYVIKVSYADTEATLEERMLAYIRSKD